MAEFLNQQIPPPANWQDFETLCADLWAKVWNDPNTQKNGRAGQGQHGIDVFGQVNGTGPHQGVQCKGKDARYGKSVTEKELKGEVEKAKTFKPRISSFVLATTAPNDAAMQKVARQLTEANAKLGLFSVSIMGWEEITRRLADYPDLIEKHFPSFGRTVGGLGNQLTTLIERQTVAEDKIDRSFHQHAKASIESNQRVEAGILQILDIVGQKNGQPHEDATNSQIDDYRDELMKKRPRTAIGLLEKLKGRVWDTASNRIKFRIITNIAACNLSLGNSEIAASGFLEAEKYEPDSETAMNNRALAYHLLGEHEKALDAAKVALVSHPCSAKAYSVLVAASVFDEKVQCPEDIVPEHAQDNANVSYAFANFYRTRGNDKKALSWYEKAYEKGGEHFDVKSNYAAYLLSSVANNQAVTLDEQRTEEQLQTLKKVEEILSELLETLKNTEVIEETSQVLHNLITVRRLLGDKDGAQEAVDLAKKLAPESADLQRQSALLYLDNGDLENASSMLAQSLETAPEENKLLYIETLLLAEKFKEALSQIDKFIEEHPKSENIELAAGQRIWCIYKIEGIEDSENEIKRAVKKYPKAIVVRIFAARVYHQIDNETALTKTLNAASSLITSETDLGDKLALAEEAFRFDQYSTAVPIFYDLISPGTNSHAMRRLLVCLFEADKRKEAFDLLNLLPDETRGLSFFRRIAAALFLRIGQLHEARFEIEKYLKLEPDDLQVRLNWIGILSREGELETIRVFLDAASDFDLADADNRIHFAHVLNEFGFSDRARKLALRLRLENPKNPTVHLGYIGLFLLDSKGGALPQPNEIAQNIGYVLEDSAGNFFKYFIGDEIDPQSLNGVLPSNHPYAKAAVGKKVGEIVVIEKNPYQSDEYTVREIKNAYLYVLHETIEFFSFRFPTNHTFMTLNLKKEDSDELEFDPIFKSLSERQERVLEIFDLYKENQYPIGVIARLLGINPIDAWRGLCIERRVQIFCCDGNLEERNNAIALIKNDPVGGVADPMFLDNAYRLGVLNDVLETVGTIGVTQSTIDVFESSIREYEESLSRGGHRHMSKQGDSFVFNEVTPDQLNEYVEELRAIRNWIKTHCDIVPAVPAKEPNPLFHEFAKLMAPCFTDTVLAASGSNRLLLSDDLRLRGYAKVLLGVEGIWLQVVLIQSANTQKISFPKYSKAVADLLEARIGFTTANASVMVEIGKQEDWALNDRSLALIASITGKNSDLKSSIRVMKDFLTSLWEAHEKEYCAAWTVAILDQFFENHTDRMSAILRAFYTFRRWIPSLEARQKYIDCIGNWCRENSLQSPMNSIPSAFRFQLLGTTMLTPP